MEGSGASRCVHMILVWIFLMFHVTLGTFAQRSVVPHSVLLHVLSPCPLSLSPQMCVDTQTTCPKLQIIHYVWGEDSG